MSLLARRRLLLSIVSNYAARIFALGVWFFLTPFLVRRLGTEAYGLYILVGSIVAYAALFDFGIANAVIKYVAEHQARGDLPQAQRLVATALRLYIGVGLLVATLAIGLAPAFPAFIAVAPHQRETAVRLVALSGLALGLSLPCSIPYAVLRGLQRFDLANLIGMVGMLAFAIAAVGVVESGGGVVGLVTINIPITLALQAPAVWLIGRAAPGFRYSWRGADPRLAGQVASFSSALFIISLAGQIQTKTDEIVIGTALPVASVTPYNLARRLSEIPQQLTDQFMKILMPLASQLSAADDRERLRTLYLVSTRLTLALITPLAVALVLLARPFLTVWVGAAYGDAAPLVAILVVASVIDTSQWPAGNLLQGMARHRRLAVIAFGSALANLGLSVWLVHPLGPLGVALGTLIPTAVEALGFVLPYTLRVTGVGWREILVEVAWPVLLPAVAVGGVVWGLREWAQPATYLALIGIGAMGGLVYAAIYNLVCRDKLEYRLLRTLVRDALTAVRRWRGARKTTEV